MKTLLLTATLAGFSLSATAPVLAAPVADGLYSVTALTDNGIEKRRKPRVRGGSGCDSARDRIEHPECR